MLKELLWWWWWWWLRTFFEVGLKINKNVAKSTKMLQFRSINCNFLHFLAIICNSVQLLAILCNNLQFRAIAFNFLQYLAEYCATSCNLVITCNYILLFASSRSWILLNLVFLEIFVAISTNLWTFEFFLSPLHGNRPVVLVAGGYAETTAEIFDYTLIHGKKVSISLCPKFSANPIAVTPIWKW